MLQHRSGSNPGPVCPGCGHVAPIYPDKDGGSVAWWCHECLRRAGVAYWKRLARRRWGKALWIGGAGPYAVVSHCAPGVTVTLWRTPGEAEAALRRIDWSSCGSRCRKAHRLVSLEAVAA